MNIPLLCKTVVFSTLLSGTISATATTVDQVINQARARIGTEQVLTGVKTIQYQGTVYSADGTATGTIVLDFMRPMHQRLRLDSEVLRETTGVNGYEGWREIINKQNPERSGIEVLGTTQVQYLLANAQENLNFFKGPEGVRGAEMRLLGEKNMEGKDCWEVLYTYPSGLKYTRYFDKSSGDLVATMSGDTGHKMVEKGTISSGGIRFPEEVHTYHNGELLRYVVFEEIKVNEPMNAAIFDFPALPTFRNQPR